MIALAEPKRAFLTLNPVQHKPPAARQSPSPAADAAALTQGSASGPVALGRIAGIKTIRERARAVLARPPGQSNFIADSGALVDRLFSGQLWHYQPIDLYYHDYQHTLQAAWVYLDLIAASRALPPNETTPTLRDAELGLVAILLHDTGYLKARGDDQGTGAKYTHSHVLRSCALAASLLPAVGCTQAEIDDVLGAIRCTGLNGRPAALPFNSARARHVACMVATADYIGQMAAPEYPVKIAHLYAEFAEADDYSRVPSEKRAFTSLAQLVAATPAFWSKFVLPKLEDDFEGAYRLLDRPDGANPYVAAIERNVAAIAARSNPPFAAKRG